METKPQILIVEDERITAEDLQRTLKYLGYAVSSIASSARDAIQKVDENKPDLILMDIKLRGDMDGVEATRRIHSRFDIPVVYITGMTEEATLQRAKKTNPFGYIHKPIEEKELYTTIEMALYRYKMERKLKESEEQYRDLVEKAGIAVLIDDIEGKFKYFNKKFVELFGYSAEEMKRQSISTLVHPEDFDRVMKFHKGRLGDKKVPSRYEFRGVRKDGSTIYLEADVSEIKKREDKIGTRAYIWDITERKQAEEAIRQRCEFEKIVSYISSKFISLSAVDDAINASLYKIGRFCGASRAYLFLFNEDGVTMDNTHEWCADGVSPQIDNLKNLPINTFPWWMSKLLKGETIHVKDVSKLPPKAKAEREILEAQDIKSLLVLPVYIGGAFAGFIGFDNVMNTGDWSDEDLAMLRISSEIIGNALERKRVEQEKEKLQVQLVQAEKMAGIGTLAGGIAHEFNNLFQIIRGHSEFARKTERQEDIEEAFDTIISKTDKAAKIIRDLLTFSSQEPSEREPCDITELIESVLLLIEEHLKKHDIEVGRKYGRTPRVEVNRGEIQQVFLNMITNARDVMLHEGGRLEIMVKRVKKNVEVCISDTGKGIEKEDLGKVFEPFYTTKGAIGGDSNHQGTGLGLSVSYGIVKRHGGTIEVQSKVGKGTTFTVKIPVKRGETEEQSAEDEEKSEMRKLEPLNILAVDDEEEICRMFTKWLSAEGHRVKSALTGKNAINLVKMKYFDIVFLDIVMPGVPAVEVLEKIKKISPKTKVVMMTGKLVNKDLWNELRQKGASEILLKPFKIEDIVEIIKG